MKLKYKYAKAEDIPEGFESLYTEKGGEFVLTGVEGIKTQEDTDRLQRSLTAERTAHKATKDAFKVLDGMDLEDVVSKLDRFDELEALAGGKDTKDVDAIVETRIKSRLAPLERERDTLKAKASELEVKVNEFETQGKTRTVHDTVRQAAAKLNILPSAIEDALMLADRNLVVGEDGTVVVKEGARGFTQSVDVDTWLTEVREARAHWWPASEGGGAGGGNTGTGGANPWSKAGWNMTQQGALYKENPTKAQNLAKSAGTTIGGPKPEK